MLSKSSIRAKQRFHTWSSVSQTWPVPKSTRNYGIFPNCYAFWVFFLALLVSSCCYRNLLFYFLADSIHQETSAGIALGFLFQYSLIKRKIININIEKLKTLQWWVYRTRKDKQLSYKFSFSTTILVKNYLVSSEFTAGRAWTGQGPRHSMLAASEHIAQIHWHTNKTRQQCIVCAIRANTVKSKYFYLVENFKTYKTYLLHNISVYKTKIKRGIYFAWFHGYIITKPVISKLSVPVYWKNL